MSTRSRGGRGLLKSTRKVIDASFVLSMPIVGRDIVLTLNKQVCAQLFKKHTGCSTCTCFEPKEANAGERYCAVPGCNKRTCHGPYLLKPGAKWPVWSPYKGSGDGGDKPKNAEQLARNVWRAKRQLGRAERDLKKVARANEEAAQAAKALADTAAVLQAKPAAVKAAAVNVDRSESEDISE